MKRITLSLTLLSAFACGGAESPPAGSVVRDSAGVVIVESTEPAWSGGEGWTVDFTPLLDLTSTGTGPNHEFYLATDAVRLPDGSFVVADDGSDEIRFFSAEGRYLEKLGRHGAGPGEFERLDQLAVLPGDSIMAYDFWAGRVTVFDPEGRVARVVSIDPRYRPRPLYAAGDAGYVGQSKDFSGFGDRLGLRRWRHPIVRVAPDGSVADTLAVIPGDESVVVSVGDAGAIWGKRGHLEVHTGKVYLGAGDSVEFAVRGTDGRLERIVRIPGYDLTLSRSTRRRELEAIFPDSTPMGPVLREIRDAQASRSHRPGFADMVIDEAGHVWLRSYQGRHEEAEPTSWLVFDPTGRWLGSVKLPPSFQVFRIGLDWILGKRTDDLDAEHVELLSLRR